MQPLHVPQAPLPPPVPQRLVPEDLLHDDDVGPALLGQRLKVRVVDVRVGQVVPGDKRERSYNMQGTQYLIARDTIYVVFLIGSYRVSHFLVKWVGMT